MPIALHRKWHLLPSGRPGERFRNRYHQHRRSKKRSVAGMIARLIMAGIAAVIGFILVFIPGPAVVFFLIAGALLATDWLPVARLLDWTEIRARRLWKRAKAFWARCSRPARAGLVALGLLLGAAFAFLSYLFIT